jgi:DNA-binding CsgD family transcriptional regulator
MFLPTDEKQFKFWKLQRDGLSNINIARSLNISRQAVSRALISMNKRIENTLLEMAQSNQIEVESINTKCGILFEKLRGLT